MSTPSMRSLLTRVAQVAADHRDTVGERPVQPVFDADRLDEAFGGPLPTAPTPAEEVVERLVSAAGPGLMGTVGPRYFGFVTGGASPASTAADMLAAGWDQCAYSVALSPAAAAAERGAAGWLKSLLRIPAGASVGFVTGAQAANTVGLAAGRARVLADVGWDVARDGLNGAPRVRVVASEERHATVDRALRLLGFGTAVLEPVRADRNGAIDTVALREVLARGEPAPTIVCLQLGNVNTGACDDLVSAIPAAREHDAWVHVDGAFGLWAAASPTRSHLAAGLEAADSWGTDAHKWLNVPYDSGLVLCSDPDLHAATMSYSASYLTGSGATADYVLGDLTAESSRRARGFAVWAALMELGADGVAALVDRCCDLAVRMAGHLESGGATIVNDVVLNQVLVGIAHAGSTDAGSTDAGLTDAVIERIQREGTCWVGGTTWRGRRLIRVSVSNATTTEQDIDLSAQAILRAVAAETGRARGL